jgi:hypothetical protein
MVSRLAFMILAGRAEGMQRINSHAVALFGDVEADANITTAFRVPFAGTPSTKWTPGGTYRPAATRWLGRHGFAQRINHSKGQRGGP